MDRFPLPKMGPTFPVPLAPTDQQATWVEDAVRFARAHEANVLEAVAKLVEEYAADPDVTDGIAAAIRALKDTK